LEVGDQKVFVGGSRWSRFADGVPRALCDGDYSMSGPPLPNEFELIARYFAPLSSAFAGAYGLLDDAAVLSPSPGNELVVKTDAIVAEVDFPPDMRADLIARKALRVNLSDLAAKGAHPRAYLVDLVLPKSVDEAWIADFATGLERDQAAYGVHLIGGDLSSTSGPVTVAVCALGEAPVGRIIRRGGAQPGDVIFVTGTIGDAALGLSVIRGELPGIDEPCAAFLKDRYELPRPRVGLGPKLIGLATAGIDVSDGLIADLRHLCAVSRLSGIIRASSVPLSIAARSVVGGDTRRLATALTGGDDYEILFTAPEAKANQIRELSQSCDVRITAVGRVVEPSAAEGSRVIVLDEHERPLVLAAEGWIHFGREMPSTGSA